MVRSSLPLQAIAILLSNFPCRRSSACGWQMGVLGDKSALSSLRKNLRLIENCTYELESTVLASGAGRLDGSRTVGRKCMGSGRTAGGT